MKTRSIFSLAASAVAALFILASCKGDENKITGYATVIPQDAVAVVSANVSEIIDKVDFQSLGLPVPVSTVKSIISSVGVKIDAPVYVFVGEVNMRRPEETPVYFLAKVEDKSKMKDGVALLGQMDIDMDVVADGDYSWLQSDGEFYGMFNEEFILLGTQPQGKKALKSLIGSAHLSSTAAGKKYFSYGGDINAFINYDQIVEMAGGRLDGLENNVLSGGKGLVAIDFNKGDVTVRVSAVGVDNSAAPTMNISPEAFSYLPERNLTAALGVGIDGKKLLDIIKSVAEATDLDLSLDAVEEYIDIKSAKGTLAFAFNGLDRYDDPAVTFVVPARINHLDEIDDPALEAGYAGKYSYFTTDSRFSSKPRAFDAKDFAKASKGVVYGYLDLEALAGVLQNTGDRDVRDVASALEVLCPVVDCMTLTSVGLDEFRYVLYMKDAKTNSLTSITRNAVQIAQSISALSYSGYDTYYGDDDYYGADDEPGYEGEDYYGADDEPVYDDWDW